MRTPPKTVVCKKFWSILLLLRHWSRSGAVAPLFFLPSVLTYSPTLYLLVRCTAIPHEVPAAYFQFYPEFFASCSPSTRKQTCCYPSLLADPQVWLTYQLQRIFHIMGSLLKSQQTTAACNQFAACAHTELFQQSCSGSRSSWIPTGEHVYPGIILFCFNLASWIYCNEI